MNKSSEMSKINAENFDKMALNEESFSIFVYSDYCPPCKVAKETLDEYKEKRKNNSRIFLLNSDESIPDNILEKYNLNVVPTFIIIKDGKIENRIEGQTSVSELEDIKF